MKYLVRACSIATLILVCVMPLNAQAQVTAQPDGWRGLIVDVSTPEDAIRILGQPSTDKSNQSLRLLMVDKWLEGGKYNQKLFRKLTFKKPEGFDEARLSFFENKLVMIELEPRTGNVPDWVDPDALAVDFNVRFTPQEWHIGKKLPTLAEFQKNMGNDTPAKFAEIYDMMSPLRPHNRKLYHSQSQPGICHQGAILNMYQASLRGRRTCCKVRPHPDQKRKKTESRSLTSHSTRRVDSMILKLLH